MKFFAIWGGIFNWNSFTDLFPQIALQMWISFAISTVVLIEEMASEYVEIGFCLLLCLDRSQPYLMFTKWMLFKYPFWDEIPVLSICTWYFVYDDILWNFIFIDKQFGFSISMAPKRYKYIISGFYRNIHFPNSVLIWFLWKP